MTVLPAENVRIPHKNVVDVDSIQLKKQVPSDRLHRRRLITAVVATNMLSVPILTILKVYELFSRYLSSLEPVTYRLLHCILVRYAPLKC